MTSCIYQTKSICLTGASLSAPTLADDLDDDWNRSYGIYLDDRPLADFQGSSYEGDIYVRVGRDAQHRSIHIRKDNQWLEWNPTLAVSVDLVGLIAYATPCASSGIMYVATLAQALQVPADVPRDIPALTDLVAHDVGYQKPKHRKRPLADVIHAPGHKRSRTNVSKAGLDVHLNPDQATSRTGDAGKAKGRRGGGTAAEKTTKDEVTVAIENMQLDDGLVPRIDTHKGQDKGTRPASAGHASSMDAEMRSYIPDVVQEALTDVQMDGSRASVARTAGGDDDDDVEHNRGCPRRIHSRRQSQY